jgi:hypothetical protein
MTESDIDDFHTASCCWICSKPFIDTDIRVRDHDHVTGKYRGAAHQKCNLDFAVKIKQYKLPIFIHNLRGYDSHLILVSQKGQLSYFLLTV